MRAGEALFIPQGWYHNVLSRPNSATNETLSCRVIAFNFWFDYPPQAATPQAGHAAPAGAAADFNSQLAALGLQSFKAVLLENGVTTVQDLELLFADDEDMQELGFSAEQRSRVAARAAAAHDEL